MICTEDLYRIEAFSRDEVSGLMAMITPKIVCNLTDNEFVSGEHIKNIVHDTVDEVIRSWIGDCLVEMEP